MKNYLFIFLICLSTFSARAQQFSGLKLGAYSGINAAHVNPASLRTSALQWDLNLVGGAVDISNNLLQFPRTNFLSFVNSKIDLIADNFEDSFENTDQTEALLQIKFLNHDNTRTHLELAILGPGLMIQTNNVSFGIYSKFKIFSHINDIPNFSRSNDISDLNSGNVFDFPEANISYMDWREIGGTISTSIEIDDYSTIHVGGTFKKLDSYNVMYTRSNQPTIATKYNDSIHYENADFEYALFSGIGYDEQLETYQYENQKTGSGYAIDIGFIYQWRQSRYSNRNQKIGFSLLDIGAINYTNSGLYQHITIVDGLIEKSKFLDENVITELQKELDIDDKNYIAFSNQHSINTPGAFQAFIESPLSKNWTLNVSVQEHIPVLSPIERPSIIMVSGYYDHKWLGAVFPLSLHNHQYVRLGAAMRVGPLSIGTDNFLPIFLPTNLRAFNAYFTLKLNSEMFAFLKRPSYYKNPKSNQGPSKVKCYNW